MQFSINFSTSNICTAETASVGVSQLLIILCFLSSQAEFLNQQHLSFGVAHSTKSSLCLTNDALIISRTAKLTSSIQIRGF